MSVAQTILEQLGGNRFLAMTGAKDLVADARSLTLKLPRPSRMTALVVTLDPTDTYTLQTYRGHGVRMTPARRLTGVHADQLQDSFRALTGLDTVL